MLIGELVKRSGISKDTIRFYEKRGLITLTKDNRLENNYKDYPETVLERLLKIRNLKGLGFTLKEVETFMTAWQHPDPSYEDIKDTLEDKVKQIELEMQNLSVMKAKLLLTLHNSSHGR